LSPEYTVVSWHLAASARGTSDSPVKWSVQLHLISLAHFSLLSNHTVVSQNKFLSNHYKTLPKKEEFLEFRNWDPVLPGTEQPEFPSSPMGKGCAQHVAGGGRSCSEQAWLYRCTPSCLLLEIRFACVWDGCGC